VRQALPLAAPRKEAVGVRLLGWNLPETMQRGTLAPPASPAEMFATAFHPDAAGTVPLARSDLAVLLAEPGRAADDPQMVAVPSVVSALIEKPGGSVVLRFDAAKGKLVRVKVETQSLGSPLIPIALIHDAGGKQVAESQGMRADREFELNFMPPADGAYHLRLRDLGTTGGPHSVFRLTLAPPQADFALTLAADTFTLAAGQPLEIPITIDRQNGFDEPIEVAALDLPTGLTAETITSQPKDGSAKSVKLLLKRAEGNAEPISVPLAIVGRSTGTKAFSRPATFALPTPFTGRHTVAWVTGAK
jgi:hypothetical protein